MADTTETKTATEAEVKTTPAAGEEEKPAEKTEETPPVAAAGGGGDDDEEEVPKDDTLNLSATIVQPNKESITDAKPVVVTEILAKEPITEDSPAPNKLEKDIIQQVEYYYSDANLARDKFLTEEIKKDDGWVPFTILLKFKRLAALSTDSNVIVDALLKSKDDLLQISADRLKIRRNPGRPLPEQNEDTRKNSIARTAYIKGFPLDLDMNGLLTFMGKFDNVVNVVMRRYLDKPTKEYKFKGSIFATFVDKDSCAKFLATDKLVYGDDEKEMEKKWQSDYYESKKEERQNDKKKNKKEEPETIKLPKGAVIHLDGLGAETTRETIKEEISQLGGEVAFIDYNKGDKAGHVRLTTENSAQSIVDKMEGSKLKIDTVEAVARVLEGDEETEFLAKVVENIKSRRNQQGGNRFRNGGRNNRQQNNRKRKFGGRNGDGPPSKK